MRILKAISILKPEMGYCQGLNYLTAVLHQIVLIFYKNNQ